MAETQRKWKFLEGWLGKREDFFPSFAYDLFANRGLTTEQEVNSFIDANYTDLYDPLSFTGMEAALARIKKAKEKNERVLVYGDYDVDGITATALMFEILNKIGVQKVETYIPHREEEGYGLNQEALTEIEKRTDLVITVDCGITSRDLIDNSKLEFIVCDHHEIDKSRLPQKAIILHPMLATDPTPLCACGMAFFFAKAIAKEFGLPEGQEKWLLDLVALATICDMVPLLGQNRILAKWGLVVLSKTKRVGLLELMKFSALKPEEITAFSVGFLLGPRLNASGRISHAKKSLELLLTNDRALAHEVARELNNLNTERQEQCSRITEEAQAEIEATKKAQDEIVLLKNKDWPRGVVGIIASRILENFNRPVIVFEDDGEVLHGSARSTDELDITEALAATQKHLLKYGGHAKAAGLSLKRENFEVFEQEIKKFAKERVKNTSPSRELVVETGLLCEDITPKTMDFLEKMEPFGFGNKTPVFVIKQILPTNIKKVGKNEEHLKFTINQTAISAIYFKVPANILLSLEDNGEQKYDLVFNLKYNYWNNQKKIDMRVVDMRISEGVAIGDQKSEEVGIAN